MKTVLLFGIATCLALVTSLDQALRDLSVLEQRYEIVNDGVMGGLSQGNLTYAEGSILFTGEISLANNGGFSWVRTAPQDLALSEAKGIEVRYLSDGRGYDFTLESKRNTYFQAYHFPLKGEKGEWTTQRLPFDAFVLEFFGRKRGVGIPDLNEVTRFGFVLGDKRDGPFRLEVASVKVY